MEERNTENGKPKKNLVLVGVCFLGAFIFIITSIISYKYGDDKKDVTDKTIEQTQIEQEKQTIKKENTENAQSSDISEEELEELKENADSEPFDTSDEEEAKYNNGFNIEGIPEETLVLVNNDIERMNSNIQETLYANGFYDYSKAVFEDYVEIDYRKETVTISLKVYANEMVDISAIYHRNTDDWETVIW